MTHRTTVPGPGDDGGLPLRDAGRMLGSLALVVVLLVGAAALRSGSSGAAPTPTAPPDPASFFYPAARPAPALTLTAQDGSAFDATRFDGGPTLVFFGYTHCPDVCPATVGILSQVLAATPGLRVVFVTVDPERDTVAFLADYVKYLPAGFTALTGAPAAIRAAADDWGVRYAKVAGTTPDDYSMSHTADVYLVDAAGRLRAHFPFGTQAPSMAATLRLVALSTPSVSPPTPVPTPVGSAAPTATIGTVAGGLAVGVDSADVWAGGRSPVILTLSAIDGSPLGPEAGPVTVQLTTSDGAARGAPVTATAVQPPGETRTFYVATLDIPTPGWWAVTARVDAPSGPLSGRASLSVQDPGTTAALGLAAPAVHTPTLADAGGVPLAVTTDPLPDLRLYRSSTTDALASGRPWVLVVDSARFRVTTACGKALILAKFMLDRWPGDTFVHLEPFAYDVVTDTAVLQGSLAAPVLVPAADAWGIGGDPWGATSMPWVFIVDRHGVVRAKYEGVMGTDDIDVILAMLDREP